MHANTVFLLGLGLLLVVGRGFGYVVPEDGVEGTRSEDDSIGRSDDLNRLELDENEKALREGELIDPDRSAAAAAAASGRYYKHAAAAGAAASRSAAAAGAASGRYYKHAAAAGAAASRSAAAASAAHRSNNRAAAAAAAVAAEKNRQAVAAVAAAALEKQRAAAAAAAAAAEKRRTAAAALAGTNWDLPSAMNIGFAAAGQGLRTDDGLTNRNELARLAALKYLDDESLIRDDDIVMRSPDYEEFLKNGEDDELMRDDPSLELYYRYISDPIRQYEEEMRSIDETVIQEPDSFSKRILETVRESTPQVYFRLIENAIRNDPLAPGIRGSAAAAAAAAGRRRAAAAAAAAAARSAAAAAAAAGRRRAAAAAAAAAGRRSASSAAAAASGWRNMK